MATRQATAQKADEVETEKAGGAQTNLVVPEGKYVVEGAGGSGGHGGYVSAASSVGGIPGHSGALAVSAINLEEDAGAGTEGVDQASQAIPFLAVLQSNSPAVVDETVEGAKAGLFMNTVTGELFKEVYAVPVSFQRRFLEWAPRAKGGGFRGEHKPLDVESGKIGVKKPDEKGIERLFNGDNQLKDTRSHFVIAMRADGTYFPAMVSMSSTQIKKSKKWISMMLGVQVRNAAGKLFNPATFSHAYRLSSVKEQNDQGQWFGILVDAAGPVTDPEVYAAAKELNKMVSAGKVQVAQPDENVGADGGEGAGGEDRF